MLAQTDSIQEWKWGRNGEARGNQSTEMRLVHGSWARGVAGTLSVLWGPLWSVKLLILLWMRNIIFLNVPQLLDYQ